MNHKIKHVMTGEFANPRIFEAIFENTFPEKYYNQEYLWMKYDIFEVQFFNELVPSTEDV